MTVANLAYALDMKVAHKPVKNSMFQRIKRKMVDLGVAVIALAVAVGAEGETHLPNLLLLPMLPREAKPKSAPRTVLLKSIALSAAHPNGVLATKLTPPLSTVHHLPLRQMLLLLIW